MTRVPASRDARPENNLEETHGRQRPEGRTRLAADIDPRHRRREMWVPATGYLGPVQYPGRSDSNYAPASCTFAVWWDGDLLRGAGWMATTSASGMGRGEKVTIFRRTTAPRQRHESTPALSRDLLGDWREEGICGRATTPSCAFT